MLRKHGLIAEPVERGGNFGYWNLIIDDGVDTSKLKDGFIRFARGDSIERIRMILIQEKKNRAIDDKFLMQKSHIDLSAMKDFKKRQREKRSAKLYLQQCSIPELDYQR